MAHLSLSQRGPVGGWLWDVRENHLERTREQVAKALGVSPSTITRAEQPNGARDRQVQLAEYYQGEAKRRNIALPLPPKIMAEASTPPTDQTDLIVVLRDQSKAIQALADAVVAERREREEWERGVIGAIRELLEHARSTNPSVGRELELPEGVAQ